MAVLHLDSFDIYGTNAALMLNGMYAENPGVVITNAMPRNGTYSLGSTGFNPFLRKVFSGGSTNVGAGYALWLNALPTADVGLGLHSWRDSGNAVSVSLWLRPDGTIQARAGGGGDGSSGTVLGQTSVPAIVANAYNHIECWVVIDGSVGTVHVAVNNVEVLALTGKNTDPNSTTSVTQLGVIYSRNSGAPSQWYLDDLFIADNSGSHNNAPYIGDCTVIAMIPNADTADADWTKSTGGTGYTLINGVPPNDAAYISSATSSNKSSFGLTALPAYLTTVKAVMVWSRQWKSDAGTSTTTVAMKSSSAVASGTTRQITTTPTYWPDVFETDPNTSSPWLPANLSAADVRITRNA